MINELVVLRLETIRMEMTDLWMTVRRTDGLGLLRLRMSALVMVA